MKKIAIGFLLFILALGVTRPAYAHGGQPRLEINTDRINPGGVVDVRGVEFGYDDLVMLALIGSVAEIALGEITANAEGEFKQIVALPSDLAEGTYYFRATTIHHWVISPPLTIWGTAPSMSEGGQGRRDEDDGLLAPMPTFAPGVVPDDAISHGQAQPASEAAPATTGNPGILVLVVLLVLGIIVVFALKIKKA